MLGRITTQINSIITKINKNNFYYFYGNKKNTLVNTLPLNTSVPIMHNGIESYHGVGDIITKSIDVNDGKNIFNINESSGLYKCTIRIDITRDSNLDNKEIIIEFREDDLYKPGWELSIRSTSETITSNLFLPLTQNKKYSIWIKCETATGDIIVNNLEITSQPMIEIETLPFI